MKKITKLLAAVLSLCLLSAQAVMAAEYQTTTITNDFENYSSGIPEHFSGGADAYASTGKGEGHGTCARVQSTLTFTFPRSNYAAGDIVDISFDYFQASAGTSDYDFILGENDKWAGIFQIDNSLNLKTPDIASTTIALNTWYNIDVRFVYENVDNEVRTHVYYRVGDSETWVDRGNLINTQTYATSLIFYASSSKSYIDNFSCTEKIKMDFKAVGYPKYLLENEQQITIDLNGEGSAYDLTKLTVTDATSERPLEGTTAAVYGKKLVITLPEPAILGHTYNVDMQEGFVTSASGDLSTALAVSFDTKQVIADFFDDFESYGAGNYLKGSNGHGFLTAAGAPCAVYTGYENNGVELLDGQAVRIKWTGEVLEYRVPYTIERGRYEIDFDMAVADVSGTWQARMAFYSPDAESLDSDWLQVWNDVVSSKNLTPVSKKHEGGTWQHYKIVLDYDQGIIQLYVGDTLFMTNPARGFDGIQFSAPQQQPVGFDNFSARFVTDYSVDSVAVVDEAGQAVDIADWDDTAKYAIKADVTNTTNVSESFVAIVAGYDAQKNLVAATAAFFTAPVSGSYTQDIEALNMAGAAELKIFTFDNVNNVNAL